MGHGGGCTRCGGMKRFTARSAPVAICSDCLQPICAKHVQWENDAWICYLCARNR